MLFGLQLWLEIKVNTGRERRHCKSVPREAESADAGDHGDVLGPQEPVFLKAGVLLRAGKRHQGPLGIQGEDQKAAMRTPVQRASPRKPL